MKDMGDWIFKLYCYLNRPNRHRSFASEGNLLNPPRIRKVYCLSCKILLQKTTNSGAHKFRPVCVIDCSLLSSGGRVFAKTTTRPRHSELVSTGFFRVYRNKRAQPPHIRFIWKCNAHDSW